MNYNALLKTALEPTGLNLFPDVYDANIQHYDENGNLLPKLSEWMTFNYVTENPTLFADDEDELTKTVIDVHCYTPDKSKIFKYKKQIKNCLRSAGFLINSVDQQYEHDTGLTHITVTVSDEDFTEV